METVTVSPKFQIVMPKRVWQNLGVEAGQKILVIQYDNRIELLPIRPMVVMRGFLKELNTDIDREPDRL